jgi:soluble lytic murein transglycosylase-like protein
MRPTFATYAAALCAALLISIIPATSASAAPKASASICADKLCNRDRASAPSCWRFENKQRVSRCFIRRAAKHYGQSEGEALAIAHRESRYQWRAVNRSSGAAGLFQFMPRTWSFTPYGKRGRSALNPRWAALGAMWMWKHGYKAHWSL